MNSDLLNNNYLIIRNFISKSTAKEHADEFKKAYHANLLRRDNQVPNSYVSYQPKLAQILHKEKCNTISDLVGSKLIPTYCFARMYHKGNVLEKHTDRSSCEVSVTVQLDGDTSWPIWITTPDGKDVSVDLQFGDGMIYLGCIAPHWREKYLGDNYSQLFFHYVREDGSCMNINFKNRNERRVAYVLNPLQRETLIKEYAKLL